MACCGASTAGDQSLGSISRVALDAPPWGRPAFRIEITLAVTETAPVAPPGEARPALARLPTGGPPLRPAGDTTRLRPSPPFTWT